MGTEHNVHGGRGTFLASVSTMSLLTITSHHHLHRSHNTLCAHKSEIISRQIPAPVQQQLPYFSHGTRVIVRDLFGSMPVRVKQRAINAEKQGGYVKDWEGLKKAVVMLLLPWPRKITVTIREDGTGEKITFRVLLDAAPQWPEVWKVCNILSQASYISSSEISSWVPVSACTSMLRINGAISLRPSITKSVQFLSFGIHPLTINGLTILHDEINSLFSNSAFGIDEDAPDLDTSDNTDKRKDAHSRSDRYTSRELKRKRRAADRWPMFYINVQPTNTSAAQRVDDILDNKANSLLAITELLKAMILGFLANNNFKPKPNCHPNPKEPESAPNGSEGATSRQHKSGAKASNISTKKPPTMGNVGKKPKKDVLGTNIDLPSFRREGRRLDSPFEAWSRVKKGVAPSKYSSKIDIDDLACDQKSNIKRPLSAPLPPAVESPSHSIRVSTPNLIQTTLTRKAIPLFSPAGSILRRPFDDLLTVEVVPRHTGESQDQKEESQLVDDDLIPWTNPVTRVTSLINKRTGVAASITLNNRKDNPRLSTRIKAMPQAPVPGEPSPWLASILDKWNNPVFEPAEETIQQLSLGKLHPDLGIQRISQAHNCDNLPFDIQKSFSKSVSGTSGRISKGALRNAEVISQVDKKYILIKLNSLNYEVEAGENIQGPLLVVIDQHAADERIRIEGLMQELCSPQQPNISGDSGIQGIYLEKPLSYIVSKKEITLLQNHRNHFSDWGISYDISAKVTTTDGEDHGSQTVIIRCLPPVIAERCKASPKLLIELIRTEIWRLHDHGDTPRAVTTLDVQGNYPWVAKIRSCPQGIIDMLNSRACRSAIMFNDELSKEQCQRMISRLAECAFPFQCAHGRPSIVPLVDLGTLRVFTDSDRSESWNYH